MKSRWNSLVVGGCNVIGLTLLALSATAGGSAVRAAGDSPALESVAIEPLTTMVSRLERRVAAFEASVAAFTHSFTATRIAARELCVADDGGAPTCITKAQLDALLKGAMQTAQAAQTTPATPEPQRHASEQGACPQKCIAPEATVAAAREEAPAEEAAAAVPPPLSVPDQQQAAAERAASVPAETIIATTAKPETVIPADAPAADEEPAQAGPATSGSAALELKAVPAEALPDLERKE